MLWKTGLGIGLGAVGAYFVLPPSAQYVLYVAVGVASALAILAMVRTNRVAAQGSWLLLALYCLLSAGGDGIENIGYGLILHRPVPFPSIADVLYLGAYPFLYVGVIGLCRRRDAPGPRENYADAAIVALAALSLSWHFLMGSDLHAADVAPLGKVVTLAYPIADLGVLFIVLQALVLGGRRLVFHRFLTASLLLAFAADTVYDLLVLYGTYQSGNAIDAGWLLNYLLIGVAALHPSAKAEVPVGDSTPGIGRIPLLASAGLIAPGILLVGSIAGAGVDVPVIAGVAMTIAGLVTLRMFWLFRRIQTQAIEARSAAADLQTALDARQQIEGDLRHQAYHDSLTGLVNRARLNEEIDAGVARAALEGRRVALCLCDLDGFKTVNDTLGHHAGDELLRVMANRLRAVVRSSDVVARLGGDEFGILLGSLDREATATGLSDRIVAALREPVDLADRKIAVSVSVGLAFGSAGATVEQLMQEADIAMYEAKRLGKSRWTVFEDAMHRKAIERLDIINGFRGSLERGEFFLEYQPQFSLDTGRLEGFEALVRWNHPVLGTIGPDRFIPSAEKTGFIVHLGRWVLEEACTRASEWFREEATSLTMSVNLSGRQLEGPHICDDVRTALALGGLPPERLCLEVTESSTVADTEASRAILAQLHEIGVELALDDFGTGYSSLAYLQRLPLQVLKIDKTFVDPIRDADPESLSLVRAVLGIADVLGLRTVAEGIEHADQARILAELGCGSAQGYHYSRPVAADAAARLISRQATLDGSVRTSA